MAAAKHSGAPARPIRIGDGGGLYLQIAPAGSKSWLFRFTLAGKAREMGLGPVGEPPKGVTLAAAQLAAAEARGLLRQGLDPIDHRAAAFRRGEAERAKAAANTFRSVAEEMIAAREAGWRNAKHRQQWRNTLATYAYPAIGDLPVSEVGTEDVLRVLRPIWTVKPETASRLRGRIERVLAYAKAMKLRGGENPAVWRGHLSEALASPRRIDGKAPGLPDRPTEAAARLGLGWTGEEAVAVAAYAALTGGSFEDVVARAANHDGDSDSTAAIAGQLWGAAHGTGALPHAWVRKLDVLDELLGLAASWRGLLAAPIRA